MGWVDHDPADRTAIRTSVFEGLLNNRDYLFGDFGAADVCAYPFLWYATGRPPGDDELFHVVLEENLRLDGFPRLREWIDRMAERPVS